MVGSDTLRKLLKTKKTDTQKYIKIDIDENCIVGWAERYYRENPKASKGDFLGDEDGVSVQITGEIRDPKHFKDVINPYTGRTNEKFRYLMDCLNDRLNKKDLGAFYTPEPYCKKAAELVQRAVDRVPDGNQYVIIDRCAGTGNLEDLNILKLLLRALCCLYLIGLILTYYHRATRQKKVALWKKRRSFRSLRGRTTNENN